MVSSTNHAYNLTVNNAASGHYALVVMTVVAVLFFPIVLLYQGWSFHVFRRRAPARRADRTVEPATAASAVRALDPRLLRRTRSARPLLALDTALGVATALCRAGPGDAARADRGPRVRRRAAATAVARPRAARARVRCCAARSPGGWRSPGAGRPGACSPSFASRSSRSACAHSRSPLDGTSGAEIAAVAVQGIEALEGYFARYLPQVVLASVVPLVVVAWVAVIDLESALIMLLTLPLVPVFMWLIGRYTEQRTRERWQALRRLSTHFLDVVRGLPTLRAFGRADDEVGDRWPRSASATAARRWRRCGSASCRARCSSWRRRSGSRWSRWRPACGSSTAASASRPGLTVLVLAPELYLPFRRLGAEYHASADGLAVAERMLALLDAPGCGARGGARRARPEPGRAPVRFERVSFAYPARAVPVLDGLDLELSPARRSRWSARAAPARARSRRCCSACSSRPAAAISVGGVDLAECDLDAWRRLDRLGAAASDAAARQRRRQHPARRSGRVRRAGRDGRRRWPAPTRSSARCPDGYATLVGDGRPAAVAGRAPADRRSPGPSCATPARDPRRADGRSRPAQRVGGRRRAVARLRARADVLLIAHRPELVSHADRVVRLSSGAAARTRDRRAA